MRPVHPYIATWCLLALAVGTFGCTNESPPTPARILVTDDYPANPTETKEYFQQSQKAMAEFRAPQVTAYRLFDGGFDEEPPRNKVVGDFLGHSVLEESAPLTNEQVQDLLAILRDESSYHSSYFSCFDPGLGFRIQEGDRTVDLVVCLACHSFKIRGDSFAHVPVSGKGVSRLLDIYEAQFPNEIIERYERETKSRTIEHASEK